MQLVEVEIQLTPHLPKLDQFIRRNIPLLLFLSQASAVGGLLSTTAAAAAELEELGLDPDLASSIPRRSGITTGE